MAVRGINTLWKQDINVLVVMIIFWQVDIMIWQVNIKIWQVDIIIWQVDIIIWQVMAEICHHTKETDSSIYFTSAFGKKEHNRRHRQWFYRRIDILFAVSLLSPLLKNVTYRLSSKDICVKVCLNLKLTYTVQFTIAIHVILIFLIYKCNPFISNFRFIYDTGNSGQQRSLTIFYTVREVYSKYRNSKL